MKVRRKFLQYINIEEYEQVQNYHLLNLLLLLLCLHRCGKTMHILLIVFFKIHHVQCNIDNNCDFQFLLYLP